MESLTCSKMPNTGYFLRHLNSLRNYKIYLFTINFNIIIQLLSRHPKSSDFPNKILYYFTISPIHATCSICDASDNKVNGKNCKSPHLNIFSSLLFFRTLRFQQVFLKNPPGIVVLRVKDQALFLHETSRK